MFHFYLEIYQSSLRKILVNNKIYLFGKCVGHEKWYNDNACFVLKATSIKIQSLKRIYNNLTTFA